MSHQRPLSEEQDVYDDSQNLLDIVPDGPTDDDILYEEQLRAALDASLSVNATESEQQFAQDDNVAESLQLEEILLASQLEAMSKQQQQQIKDSTIPKASTADENLVCDCPSDKSESSDDDKSQELADVLEGPKNVTRKMRNASRRKKQRLKRLQARSSQETSAKLTWVRQDGETGNYFDEEMEEEINPELAEVLKMTSENARTEDASAHMQTKQFHNKVDISNRKQVNVETQLRPSPLNENGIPVTWDCEASNLDGSVDFTLVKLSPGSPEYDAICQDFEQISLQVTAVERLQNFMLLDRYRKELEHICDNRQEGFDVNEQYLYHGTKAEKKIICEESLDQRLGRKGHFGRGIYFSDNPRKCLQYCETSDPQQHFHILKCRVILGDTKVYPKGESDTNLKREPPKDTPSGGWKYYDSVQGCPRDFNEFVIYDSRRAITEFIITCKKCEEELTSNGSNRSQKLMKDEAISHATEGGSEDSGAALKSSRARVLNKRETSSNNGSENTRSPSDNDSASGDETDDNSVSSSYSTASESEEITDIHSGAAVASPSGASADLNPGAANVLTSTDQRNQARGASGGDSQDANPATLQTASAVTWQVDDEDTHNQKVELVRQEMKRQREQQRKGGTPQVDDVDTHNQKLERVRKEMRQKKKQEKNGGKAWSSGKGSFLGSDSGNAAFDDPVNHVMSKLIAEFLEITEIDNTGTARRFIEKSDMDLERAINDYCNSMDS